MPNRWLSLSGVGPLHAQVFSALREAITSGRIEANERLPSSRTLAESLGLSRTPTQTAYEQLVAEGYAVTKHGAGTFAAEGAVHSAPRPKRSRVGRSSRCDSELSKYASNVMAHVPSVYMDIPERPSLRHDFLYGVPAPELFPASEWRRALNAAAKSAPFGLSEHSPQGLVRLRTAIAGHLRRSRGVECTADQILVTSGVQQGLQLASRVLCNPGDTVLLEEPGYPGARATCRSEGLKVTSVRVDEEGIDIHSTPSAIRNRARFAYTTPAHQFPMGSVLSFPRRRALVGWADTNDAFVFEDDYDGEFRYEGKPIESLYGLDEHERVIYAGTFSKTFSLDLRIGFLVLPEQLVDPFRKARWVSGWGNPVLEQAALATFIEEGHFARHLGRCRKRYGERRTALIDSLRAEFAERAVVVGDRSGLHMFVRFLDIPRSRNRAFVKAAFKLGIGIYPIDDCYDGQSETGGFLLGYSLISRADMRDAVRGLRKCVNRVSTRKSSAA